MSIGMDPEREALETSVSRDNFFVRAAYPALQKFNSASSVLLIIKLIVRARSFAIVLVFLASAIAGATDVAGQGIYLNEILASNSSTLADEDGDFEDWIELFNAGAEPVNLGGYGLSDDYDQPFRWVIPDETLDPGEFLLIWASGKDRRNAGSELHTNFSIAAAGEEVLLTDPDGKRADELSPTAIPTDVSLGRQPDGSGEWFFFNTPTPGEANDTDGYQEILDPPLFSHPAGFYDEGFDLVLSVPVPGATIYYTVDGSEPSPENLEGTVFQYKNEYPRYPGDPDGEFLERAFLTQEYVGSISVTDRTGSPDPLSEINTTNERSPVVPEEPVFQGTVVRARAYKEGYLPSPVVTQTYLIQPGMADRYDVSVVSLTIPSASLFDYRDGIYVAGEVFDTWRDENPLESENPWHWPGNYSEVGEDWERMVNFELFSPTGALLLDQQAGVRIHGGVSRTAPQKTLRVYARTHFGAPEFNHQFFSSKETTTFKRILLRNSGNDNPHTMFRDALMHSLVQDLDLDHQAYEPAIVFINGEFWGLHNFRDRVDRYYLHYRHGVDADNLDILTERNTVKEGGNAHYNAMIAYIEENDMTDPDVYGHVGTLMDIENFIDYQVAQIYFANTDWPANNQDFWRLRTDAYEPDAPYGHDGRWRWILYDTDFGFGWRYDHTHNTLKFATEPGGTDWPNPDWSTFLLRTLLQNEEFRSRFINRVADFLNTIFHADTVTGRIDTIQGTLAPLMGEHIGRWRRPGSIGAWNSNVGVLRTFAAGRPDHIREHADEYFDLGGTATLTVRTDQQGQGTIRINTIHADDTSPGGWSGIYFQGVPVEIEAVPAPGYQFSHWEGLPPDIPSLTEITLAADSSLTAHFEEAPHQVLVHYWHFNDMTGGETDSVAADYSATGAGIISYPGSGDGHMDDTEGTYLNARQGHESGLGLRVRNPSDERELIFQVPSTGFEDLEFSFAVHRTNNGAREQEFYYSPDGGDSWTQVGDSYTISLNYDLVSIDLSDFDDVNDNSALQFRILFVDESAAGSVGNNRFDNFALDGTALHVTLGRMDPPGAIRNEEYPGHTFLRSGGTPPYSFEITTGAFPEGMVLDSDGKLSGTPIKSGTFSFAVTVTDSEGETDSHSFTLSVTELTAPHRLMEGPYQFTSWPEDAEAGTFPESMEFVYMDTPDPGLTASIAGRTSGKYDHADRTRINGSGSDGFSFINTSNGNPGYPATRLGGAILSLDTSEKEEIHITFQAGTKAPNSRVYHVRLQYRTARDQVFKDVYGPDGRPLEYARHKQAGHSEIIGPFRLPEDAENQPRVELFWRYYYTGERDDPSSGQRSELLISEISVEALRNVSGDDDPDLPETFALHPNHPNPFNPATNVTYDLPIPEYVTLQVYNVLGELVEVLVDAWKNAGTHQVRFDASELASGIYFYHLQAGAYRETRRMVLVK